MVQMNMHRGVDEGLVIVLDICQLVADGGHRVIVDHDDGPDHPLILVLPFVLG